MHWWVWVLWGVFIVVWPWLAIRGFTWTIDRGAEQEEELGRHPSLRKYVIWQAIPVLTYSVAMLYGLRVHFSPAVLSVWAVAVMASIIVTMLRHREVKRLRREDAQSANAADERK